MRPFALRAGRADAAERGRAPVAGDPARALPRRRHEPRRPHEARRRDARRCSSTSRGCRSTRSRSCRDGGLRIGARRRATATSPPTRAVRERYPALSQALLAGASGQLRNMATVGGNLLQRTRCAYFQDVTKPCNKRVPGSGCPALEGEHRNLRHPRRTPSTAWRPTPRTWPWRSPPSTPSSHVHGPGGDAHDPDRRACTACPATSPQRDTVLEPGELITGVELPPLPVGRRSRYRKVRDRASYAFAVGSVAAALDVEDGAVRDVRHRLRRGGARAVARAAGRGGPARRARRRRRASPRAADAELAAAGPCATTPSRSPLARNLVVRMLTELARRRDDRTATRVGRRARCRASRAARRSPAPPATPSSTRSTDVAYGWRADHDRPRAGSRHRRRARPRAARRARRAARTATRRACSRVDDARARGPAGRRVAYRGRSSRAGGGRDPEAARRPPALVPSTTTRAARRRAARRPPRPLHARQVNPAFPTDTGEGRRRGGARPRAAVRGRRDLHARPRSTTTRWSRTPRRAVGRTAAWRSRLHPGRAAVAQATRQAVRPRRPSACA